MHGDGDRAEKQSSILQRMTEHERPADKAYWNRPKFSKVFSK